MGWLAVWRFRTHPSSKVITSDNSNFLGRGRAWFRQISPTRILRRNASTSKGTRARVCTVYTRVTDQRQRNTVGVIGGRAQGTVDPTWSNRFSKTPKQKKGCAVALLLFAFVPENSGQCPRASAENERLVTPGRTRFVENSTHARTHAHHQWGVEGEAVFGSRRRSVEGSNEPQPRRRRCKRIGDSEIDVGQT